MPMDNSWLNYSLWFICHRISLCGRHVGDFPGSQLVLEQTQAACKPILELEGVSRQFLNRNNPKIPTLRLPSNIFPSEKRTTSKALYQTTGVGGGELEWGEMHPMKFRMECCQQKCVAIELQTLVVTQQSQSLWAKFAPKLAGAEREKQHHFNWEGFLFLTCPSFLRYGTSSPRRHFGWCWDPTAPTEAPNLWQQPWAQTAKSSPPPQRQAGSVWLKVLALF